MSSFGFTFLSRKALGQAEQAMLGGAAGVRDEVGFLIIHQRYSDHFFPGTSVLHTRLRYALLIPWIYQVIREKKPSPRDFGKAYIDMEHDITGRLKFDGEGGEKDGVIGGEVYPAAISQPPAYVYWTALAKWGLIGTRPDGRQWSRADMARLLASSKSRSLLDDDGRPLETVQWPIAGLPEVPNEFYVAGKMSLKMPKIERQFLSRKLKDVRRPGDPTRPALLARLVGKGIDDAPHCWDQSIMALAGDDAPALLRAGQAAALSAIGRAVYAAQVETIKCDRDKRAPTVIHREHLPQVMAMWGKKAAALNMELFFEDVGHLPAAVRAVLVSTHEWVRRGEKDPMKLLEPYALAERSRKQDRTRLSNNQFGVDRRLEWEASKHGKAEPLHYRWNNVKRLLRDLTGTP